MDYYIEPEINFRKVEVLEPEINFRKVVVLEPEINIRKVEVLWSIRTRNAYPTPLLENNKFYLFSTFSTVRKQEVNQDIEPKVTDLSTLFEKYEIDQDMDTVPLNTLVCSFLYAGKC